MNHDISLVDLHVQCTCGDLDTYVTDVKFYEAVASRHLLSLGLWPFEKGAAPLESDDE